MEDGSAAGEDDDTCDAWAILMRCIEDALRTNHSRVIHFVWVVAEEEDL